MAVAESRKPRGPSSGFTLIELMVVIAIIGILASLAYSAYDQYVTRSRRAEAFAALEQMAGAMEKNFTINASYLPSTSVNFIVPPATIFDSTVPLDGGDAYYNLRVRSPAETSFTVRAVPIGVQAGDGTIEMDNDGSKRWDQNNSGCPGDDVCPVDAGEDDWKKD